MSKHSLSESALHRALNVAQELGRRAAAEILSHWPPTTHRTKYDGSEVTAADVAAERIMRLLLAEHYPGVPILGEEEGGEVKPIAGLQWIIDPLDGTTSFALGSPVFGTLIALLEDGEPMVGVAHFPVSDETTYAAKGLGAWHRVRARAPERIHARSCAGVREAFASATGVHYSDLRPQDAAPHFALSRVINRAGKFRFVGDCLQHTLVARGRLDLAIDTRMAPWDSAALIPVLREAGAVCACIDGNEEVVFGGSLVSAGNEEVLQELRQLLQPITAAPL